MRIRFLTIIASFIISSTAFADPDICTYDSYKWNVQSKRAVERIHVEKPYADLTPDEIEAHTGCSICKEDQIKIMLRNGRSAHVCKYVARRVETALNTALEQGAIINTLTAYRVGRTRGDLDDFGNRTKFSNHSFGIAVDINEAHNGLYGQCFQFGSQCQLRKGGPWQPDTAEGLTRGNPIVQALKTSGFQWGGEIQGRQKDFMHFSPSGY